MPFSTISIYSFGLVASEAFSSRPFRWRVYTLLVFCSSWTFGLLFLEFVPGEPRRNFLFCLAVEMNFVIRSAGIPYDVDGAIVQV
ncbi:4313_t:CDS:2 [Dentiscutata heterogama]|uniref:4313_t:CDS:1 n=1 Tax=Dentiscutata heterogama TaxID=1316150 RepID=A0ACA9JVJ1_9GLOM|nr:4313_t:CDS:2 [Dentiscutata heterogama]